MIETIYLIMEIDDKWLKTNILFVDGDNMYESALRVIFTHCAAELTGTRRMTVERLKNADLEVHIEKSN